eukprot:scaffold21258_cov58-Cyclotella_meneghiniana.AAC.9
MQHAARQSRRWRSSILVVVMFGVNVQNVGLLRLWQRQETGRKKEDDSGDSQFRGRKQITNKLP